MKRKLFCELSPFTYRVSTKKEILLRNVKDMLHRIRFAQKKSETLLPVVVYRHKSLIRRRLGNVDMTLQENKATNLMLSAPEVDTILIAPGETFSFWHLVGNPTSKRGYRTGLTIANGKVGSDIGGGMCQFTNLLHWMVLHSDLTITEHHHHDRYDLFPDFNRQIPFGTGTSIMYNYKDYRLVNQTDKTYQFHVWTTDEYLCGELRADSAQMAMYHICSEEDRFVRENEVVYRTGRVQRRRIDSKTGALLQVETLRQNHAQVLYDTTGLTIVESAPLDTAKKEALFAEQDGREQR